MFKKKKILAGLIGALLGISMIACSSNEDSNSNSAKKSDDLYTIGISQLVQHDALDSAKDGFVDGLKEKGYEEGKNIKFDYQNAQGDVSIAQTISKQFINNKVDMIFAIATPAAQAAYNATSDIPIVFTAVTDPVEAEIADSFQSSGNNVTGTSDMVPMEEQLKLLLDLVQDIDTIGVIYNTSEANSIIQVNQLKEEAEKYNIKVKEISTTTVNEINQNLSAVINSIDALYVPTDNTVASAYELVSNICISNSVPVLCAEEAGVSKGGLCSIGIDYYKLGKEAAYKAAEIIEGKKPSEIEITTLSDMKIVVNTDVAKKIGINIPEEIAEKAEKVTGGVN